MLTGLALKAANRIMASRKNDFAVGPKGEEPYMLRWWVIPRNKWFNVYLHKFLHDDEDRALHDHPWISCSWILSGGYREVMQRGFKDRVVGDIAFRSARTAHRIILGDAQPVITLFFTGPVVRVWGFLCPKGWIPWTQFVDERDAGAVGRGCE